MGSKRAGAPFDTAEVPCGTPMAGYTKDGGHGRASLAHDRRQSQKQNKWQPSDGSWCGTPAAEMVEIVASLERGAKAAGRQAYQAPFSTLKRARARPPHAWGCWIHRCREKCCRVHMVRFGAETVSDSKNIVLDVPDHVAAKVRGAQAACLALRLPAAGRHHDRPANGSLRQADSSG